MDRDYVRDDAGKFSESPGGGGSGGHDSKSGGDADGEPAGSDIEADDELRPHSINAVHSVRDRDKVDALAESMEENGWVGPPVLIEDVGGGNFQAWNGTHRLAAARKVGIDVPVVFVDTDALEAAGFERGEGEDLFDSFLATTTDDRERAELLKIAGDDRGNRVIEAELENNARDELRQERSKESAGAMAAWAKSR